MHAHVPAPALAYQDLIQRVESVLIVVRPHPSSASLIWQDLIQRVESVLIDIEQQTSPVLVVSHLSTLQLLRAYFAGTCRGTPTTLEKALRYSIPHHTVLQASARDLST